MFGVLRQKAERPWHRALLVTVGGYLVEVAIFIVNLAICRCIAPPTFW